jgi:hypothetical protein
MKTQSKRHAKPTAAALAARTYRKVLAMEKRLENQMALIRLDMQSLSLDMHSLAKFTAKTMRPILDHCVRLLREKETLQRQLSIMTAEQYTVTEEHVPTVEDIVYAPGPCNCGWEEEYARLIHDDNCPAFRP